MLVETCVGRLFVDRVGRGPDVVLWPSLLTDGAMWRPQVDALRERYRFTIVDPPGHGRSQALRRPYTLDDCVEGAVQLLAACGLSRAGWAGLSWGGMVGMRLASRHPERVAALALLDTSARRDRPAKLAAYRALAAVERIAGPVRALGRVLLPVMFCRETLRQHPELAEAFLDKLVRMDRVALAYAVDAVMFSRRDVTSELSRITAPTLVLVGEQDVATPPREAEHLVAHVPGAQLVRIPRAGHLTTLEQPEAVTAALDAFFARTLGAG
jgi:pimeloyl-ACP methyl ester carboxylesterase